MFPGNGLCASFEDVFLQTNTLRLILNRQYLFLYQGYSAMFSQQPRDIRIYLSTGKVPVNLRNTTSFRTLSVPALLQTSFAVLEIVWQHQQPIWRSVVVRPAFPIV